MVSLYYHSIQRKYYSFPAFGHEKKLISHSIINIIASQLTTTQESPKGHKLWDCSTKPIKILSSSKNLAHYEEWKIKNIIVS